MGQIIKKTWLAGRVIVRNNGDIVEVTFCRMGKDGEIYGVGDGEIMYKFESKVERDKWIREW